MAFQYIPHLAKSLCHLDIYNGVVSDRPTPGDLVPALGDPAGNGLVVIPPLSKPLFLDLR
ncbi:MAG TPA: hypothetical protein VEJ87_12795 [Acidimicrobiales bacterium]|nr:hypothetical protein [Acidimicrobiales bacterium]